MKEQKPTSLPSVLAALPGCLASLPFLMLEQTAWTLCEQVQPAHEPNNWRLSSETQKSMAWMLVWQDLAMEHASTSPNYRQTKTSYKGTDLLQQPTWWALLTRAAFPEAAVEILEAV